MTPTAPVLHPAALRTGWCTHCRDRGAFEEVTASRLREQDLHDREEARPPSPHIQALDGDVRECGDCGQAELDVVTMWAVAEDGTERPAGGWAICRACGATPHPTTEAARG
jgi:hypothetical protein